MQQTQSNAATGARQNSSYHNTSFRFRPDKCNSSFHWEFAMNFDQKVPYMVGYSKNEGQREAINKADCFASKIEMFYKNGYFFKARKITVYQRTGMFCNKEIDKVIFEATPEAMTFYPAEYIEEQPGEIFAIKTFMSNLRLRIENGIAPKVHLRLVQKKK